MAQTVFVSHAGADTAQAITVADLLSSAGVHTLLDRREVRPGDSFLAFMEQSLVDSDYCLLLWSRNAAGQAWVTMEWEAALYRSVHERRSFLITGRLEDCPLPALLACRLRVDLFPDWQPGVGQLISLWQCDREIERSTKRPVANAVGMDSLAPGSTQVFITSAVFGITVPVRTALEYPTGILLDRVVKDFRLPHSFDHERRIGVRFDYALARGDRTLERAVALNVQGVQENDILWLETTMMPYSTAEPVRGRLTGAVLRHGFEEMTELAQRHFAETVSRNGLGRDYRPL
jgi:TIR domain